MSNEESKPTPGHHPESGDWVEAARQGDVQARDLLFRMSERALRRFVRAQAGQKLRRFVSVSDLCQEASIRAFRALEHLREGATPEDFRRLLWRHARWTVQEHGRKVERLAGESAAREAGDSDAPDGAADRTGEVTRRDEILRLRSRIRTLPARYAAVLELHADGRSAREIAERLDLPLETVRSRILRGSEKLRQAFRGARREAES